MAEELRPLPIQDIQRLADGVSWSIDQHLPELETLTPVRGAMRAAARGQVLEVEGEASTIVTLRCDRCLQHFHQPLCFRSRELLWLDDTTPAGAPHRAPSLTGVEAVFDPEADAISETLDARGDFNPARWAFEQLSLQLPLVNRCGRDCPGPDAWSSAAEPGDPRWHALRTLKP